MLVLVAVLFVGPLFVSNLWGYLQSRKYLTEAAFRNIRNVAALEASQTLEYARSAQYLVPSLVAGNQYLFGMLNALDSATSAEQSAEIRKAMHAHLAAKAKESSSAEEFQIVSLKGALIATSRPGDRGGADQTATTCWNQRGPQARIAGFDHRGHEPKLLIVAPIKAQNGAPLALFCARFAFDVHRELILAHKKRTTDATLFLLDERGEIVCGSFEEREDAPYGQTFSRVATEGRNHDHDDHDHRSEQAPAPPVSPGSDEPWEGRYLLESGEAAMAAYAPIPELGWGVVAEVPVHRALAGLERLKWQAVGASVTLALTLLIAVLLGWRTIMRPLKVLAGAADEMASGATGRTVAVAGPDEFVNLGNAFNRMSLALEESQHDLERRIAERTKALQSSQEFAELLLNSIDSRVVVIDRDHRIVKTNAAAVRMYGRDLVGELAHEVFEGTQKPAEDSPSVRTFETGRAASGERSQRMGDRREAVRIETYPVDTIDGRVASVIQVGRTVTEEKQLQLQMMHHEKMAAFGLLAAGVAHEIGNPLAAIQSQLQLAQGDERRTQDSMKIVKKEVDRIARLLRELVTFARRKRDEVMLISANQVIDDVVRLVGHDPRARTVEIRRDLEPDLKGIRAKEDHLIQVLLNLGLNALDAMPNGGHLLFETTVHEGDVVIRVCDSGDGIPESARQELFEPFFTTKSPGRGTGLGLFVSRSIVEGMGGRLELEQTSPEGTTFRIAVPGSS